MPWAGGHHALARRLAVEATHLVERDSETVQDHHEGSRQHQLRHPLPRTPVSFLELLLLLHESQDRPCEEWFYDGGGYPH